MSKELQLTQLPIHGVDKEHETIVIRIRLNKKKDDIISDIKSLLDALDWEAKYFNIDMRRPRPHLKFLSDALMVYDLHKEQKKSWKEIGLALFKYEGLDAAMSKARHHYKEAEKMINGGWKELV